MSRDADKSLTRNAHHISIRCDGRPSRVSWHARSGRSLFENLADGMSLDRDDVIRVLELTSITLAGRQAA